METTIIWNDMDTFSVKYDENFFVVTVIPRFTSKLVPKKGDVNWMTMRVEVRGNKKFDEELKTTLIEAR